MNQMGCNISRHPAIFQLQGMTQQFYLITGRGSNVNILQVHLTDAFHGSLGRSHFLAPCQIRQNADLAARVNPLHIGGGVCLGIALGLSFLQSLLKGDAALDHAGQDIVGGSVQDAYDLFDLVACQALVQGTQKRNGAADTGLKQVVDILLFGDGQQFLAVSCNQLLVGSDHMLAGQQSPPGEFQSYLGAANGLNHHFHFGVILNDGKILDHQMLIGIVLKITDIQNILDSDLLADFLNNAVVVHMRYMRQTGTQGSVTHDRKLCHNSLSSFISSARLSACQNLKFYHAVQRCHITQQLFQRFLHIAGLGRNRHCRTAVGGDTLVDGQDVGARCRKNGKHTTQNAGGILQHRIECDDMFRLHIVEGLNGILILIECAAADAGPPGGFPNGFHFACLHHAFCLCHFDENLRQSIGSHDIILDRFRHYVHLLRSFVSPCRSYYHIFLQTATKRFKIFLLELVKVPPFCPPVVGKLPVIVDLSLLHLSTAQ